MAPASKRAVVAGTVIVGTSGWSEPVPTAHWYPPGLAARDRLGCYAQRFDGVEVNSTFYAVPSAQTVARWARTTPPGFSFDVKLHRLLSRHATAVSSLPGDLRGQAEADGRGRVKLDAGLERALCRRTLTATQPLRQAHKLSSFVLQLTPSFRPATHRLAELEAILRLLAPTPVAIELRHRDWLDDPAETLSWFRAVGAAFVCVDAPAINAPVALPPFDAVTRDDLGYLRAHGRNADGYLRGRSAAERFCWRYSEAELCDIAERTERLARSAERVRVMFGNGLYAMDAAQRLRRLLGARACS
jgi:uncharacterized protein YecE (DUF72 family)